MRIQIDSKLIRYPAIRLAIKLLIDAFSIVLAWVISYWIRFPLDDFGLEFSKITPYLPVFILVQLICFGLFRQYSTMWRYSNLHTIETLFLAATLSILAIASGIFFFKGIAIPRSILVVVWVSVLFITGAARLIARKVSSYRNKLLRGIAEDRRILIYGAGQAGELLLRNIENTKQLGLGVVGFIDDDPVKSGMRVHNKRVMGNGGNIGEVITKFNVNEIIFSIPSLSGHEVRRMLTNIKDQAGNRVVIKIMPGLADLVDNRIQLNAIRKVEIADLLRRSPVKLDNSKVQSLITGKSVMVVGGGGSIGRELCHQIATHNPERLVIVDNSEYNLYAIESDLSENFHNAKLYFAVIDACDAEMMWTVFAKHKPAIVFNAAAYKHVPLMEVSPWSAVKNNLTSTLVLEELCIQYNVGYFILISTDKAVRPTSVMGATKRICEQISLFNKTSGQTKFITVRFGNVLGSSGSVIPKFTRQIEEGCPVTVTHPKITRYFMLVSEAVELVLHAATIRNGGDIYVLDMGEPIYIDELAKMMIALSGLRINEDIRMVYTGLRPGEKLYENLYLEGEERMTDVPNLLILSPQLTLPDDFLVRVRNLIDNLHHYDHLTLRQEIKKLVPEYEPNFSSDLLQ